MADKKQFKIDLNNPYFDGFETQTPEQYKKIIYEAAVKNQVPTSILSSLLAHESMSWNPGVISGKINSPAGAIGIAQFMPATAKGRGVNPLDVNSAINGAAKYLKDNYSQFGTWDKALAAYNAGEGAVEMYNGVPPYKETQNYVQDILYNRSVQARKNTGLPENSEWTTRESPPTATQTRNPYEMIPVVNAQTNENMGTAPRFPEEYRTEEFLRKNREFLEKPILKKVFDFLNPFAPAFGAENSLQPESKSYVTRPGDTMWGIAERTLGSGSRWKELGGYTGRPEQLPVGQKINIPTPPVSAPSYIPPSQPVKQNQPVYGRPQGIPTYDQLMGIPSQQKPQNPIYRPIPTYDQLMGNKAQTPKPSQNLVQQYAKSNPKSSVPIADQLKNMGFR